MSLISLVKNNDIDGVRDFLLNETINVNLQDKSNYTALVLASRKNYIEIIILLLEIETINVNLQTKYGGTALMWASRKGYIEVVKLLLEHEDINVNLQDIDEETALIFASKNSYIEIVELLLAKGATLTYKFFMKPYYSKKINEVLTNWKTYLPRWNRFKTCKYYPKEFNEIAIQWLLICKRKNFVSEDIKLLMIEYFAESWKLT